MYTEYCTEFSVQYKPRQRRVISQEVEEGGGGLKEPLLRSAPGLLDSSHKAI